VSGELSRHDRPSIYPRRRAELAPPGPRAPLERSVAARPGRFLVGFDGRSLYPPPEKLSGIPLSTAAYVGRVEEVDPEGGVTVRAWARPSGWEGLTIIDTHKAEFDRAPSAGDLLWIWTWVESRRGAESTAERIVIEVEHRELGQDDRARIGALLASAEDDAR
jgi:hypothetical protein